MSNNTQHFLPPQQEAVPVYDPQQQAYNPTTHAVPVVYQQQLPQHAESGEVQHSAAAVKQHPQTQQSVPMANNNYAASMYAPQQQPQLQPQPQPVPITVQVQHSGFAMPTTNGNWIEPNYPSMEPIIPLMANFVFPGLGHFLIGQVNKVSVYCKVSEKFSLK